MLSSERAPSVPLELVQMDGEGLEQCCGTTDGVMRPTAAPLPFEHRGGVQKMLSSRTVELSLSSAWSSLQRLKDAYLWYIATPLAMNQIIKREEEARA